MKASMKKINLLKGICLLLYTKFLKKLARVSLETPNCTWKNFPIFAIYFATIISSKYAKLSKAIYSIFLLNR